MNKTPSVFLRNPENMNEMTREVNPLCQWVLDGEGVATRKYDGTCVMRDDDGYWWARREIKKGKTAPEGWVPVETDDVTGKRMGWVPFTPQGYGHPLIEALGLTELAAKVMPDGNGSLQFKELVRSPLMRDFLPGTYELCGPKINGNPEGYENHVLVKHSDAVILPINHLDAIDYDRIKHVVLYVHEEYGWEGIVWHHPDGRMAKMKARDYKLEKS